MNDEDNPEPADGQLVWIWVAFIFLMLFLMALNTWL